MKKLIIAFTVVFTLSNINAFAQPSKKDTLKAVLFEGLSNVKEKTARRLVKSKAGKPYSEETVKADIQSILSNGSFDDVEVSIDTATYRLVFIVKERPYVKTITFKGNKKISSGRLRDEATIKQKEFYDVARFEESKAKILALYADKGYSDCKLEAYPTTDSKTNLMAINFLITEGNKIVIGEVIPEGVKAYKNKKILKLMKSKKKKIFKEDVLQKDIQEIETFYKNNGFINVKVGEYSVTYDDKRTSVKIKIPVSEGARYKVGKISFTENPVYTEKELRKAVALKAGNIFKDEEFQETRMALMELYSDKGYLHCQLEPEYMPDDEKGVMNINFRINENEVIYLGRVYIDGLVNTKEFVIRREITLNEGDVFAAPKVRRSMEKIYNLGFIDSVEPDIQPTSQPNVMDLVMNIGEGKPGILSAGAGYSSIDQLVGTLQLQHINLFSRAQRLNLMWEFGARKQNYEIGWTDPWFLDKPMSFGLNVFNTERLRDYGSVFSAYKEGRKGGSVSVGPRLSDYLSLGFSYTYEEVGVYDITNLIADSVSETHDITSSVNSQIVWDSRDNIFDATKGNRQSLAVQYAGDPLGGNINFIKPIVKSSWFFPSFWKFVLSLNGTFGLVQNFGNSATVPIYEKFYVGGAETVRGYQYRSEIGPTEGGKVSTVFNIEYKFPIVQEKKRTILQGAFFADAGGAWDDIKDLNLEIGNGTRNIKTGVGFGIRFTTPVFPLRLDWGYGLNHNTGEELSQFYFTIGNIF